MKKIAIIGAGAYGSYTASLLNEIHPNWQLHIYDIGDDEIKDENGMGLYSELINCRYDALTKGRYFGFGGATAKWGGQILTFSRNDFKNPKKFMEQIVELNEKYRQNIFKKVGIENNHPEEVLDNGMFTKTGVWLDYFNRNLFKKFNIRKMKNVTLHPKCRVCKINCEKNTVTGFIYKKDGQEKQAIGFDYYVLSAGAFETTRLMMVSGYQDPTCVYFSDHIVKKVFKIKGDTKVGPVDFGFSIKKASFITTRIIGQKDNISYFAYPVFNSEFPFFQNLKSLLFGKSLNLKIIKSILKDIPSCIAFIWDFLIKRKLYVYRNEWYMGIHMENIYGNGKCYLSDKIDKFGEKGLAIDFHISKETENIFGELSDSFEKYLKENNVLYVRLNETVHTEKFEDEYHPFALYSEFNSVEEYYHQFTNMLVIHSGVLPHAGGINSTAAAFPLIEDFFRVRYK